MDYGDLIDSRDLIARLEELRGDREFECDQCGETVDTSEECDAHTVEHEGHTFHVSGEIDEDSAAELAMLEDLEAEGAEDWSYGATFVRASYFEAYAEQLAEDVGAIDPDASWPLSFIDWEAAAEALKVDYSERTIDGETYYVRG